MVIPPALEIVANSLASAQAAQTGGATRIELCAALELGGVTPSWAQIALVRERVSIPLHVLIRPRAGDFVYDDDEIAAMSADVAHCAASGCEGVVLGALTEDGDIDIARCRELVNAAGALELTFHRAIDVCRDPTRALEDVIALGFRRLLSSGGASSAPQGVERLRDIDGTGCRPHCGDAGRRHYRGQHRCIVRGDRRGRVSCLGEA